ncbi:hypothetical protein K8M07_02620 [Schnuerera sp. xch1]|uniref:sugar phosphate nucleotidyltransferase n=1 Tax=Schnuerera sp. xch1 TaxID=2874283 RepID=UPI001CBD4DB3|nr:sugar phosphate nucleotidyltransferase [Schnuerera sp. xch1]MBZ2174134.1 hypothetical protein [Schnuerera sp. xch1]
MSGGIGTRLRPLTCDLPKPMVPIFNKPVMEYAVDLLKKNKIEDIAVTLHYLPNMIIDYFEDGRKFDVDINYYIEDKPLGTGGSVKNAQEFLDDTLIVISGDAFTNINLKKAYEFHKKKDSKATLILKRESVPLEYGVVITDEEGKIIRFLEKPSWGEVFSDTINTGIYILEPEVFNYYEKGQNFDFSKDLFPKLLEDNIPMYGYIADEYWCDVGDLNSYIQTHTDILSDADKHYLIGANQGNGIWIGEGSTIEKGTKIYPPIFIGENSTIKAGTIIEPYTIIGKNCFIGEGSSIKRSILWDSVNISKNCEIRKSVICNNVNIEKQSRIFEGVAIGAHSKISKNSTIKPKVKIWPYKTIEENMIVTDNLVWEERATKKLFGYRNISGKFNETITPEIVTKLGVSFATVIKEKGTFVVNSDEYNTSKSVKNSIVSGILSTGSLVIDIKNSTMPMCRFGVKYFKADGGIQIRTNCSNENMVYIEFIDAKGANINKGIERKVESCFVLENFKRCLGNEIKDVVNIYNFSQIYLKEGIQHLKNGKEIKSKKPKLIISSPSKNISRLAEKYLMDIGCKVKVVEFNNQLIIEDIRNKVLDEDGYLGILYSSDGEKIALTDGYNIVEDDKYYLLTLLIGFKTGMLKEVVIPYNYPRIVEKLAKEYKGRTIYSKSNISEIIKTVMDKSIDFQYIVNFDSIWATGKIIDYLIGNDVTINELLQELPEYYYFKKEIPCKWTDKGKVIRRLTEDRKKGIELKQGVRFIDDKGWVLVIPDDEKPKFNLYIEGYNEEYAEELWTKYDKKVKNLMKT